MKTLILAVALVSTLLAAGSVYIVNENQVAVLFQFGQIRQSNIEPGIHFKLPLIQEVRRFDRRILTLDAQPERYLTGEKKDVSVDFFAKWRIKDVSRYYQTTSGDEMSALTRLNPIIREAIRNEISQRTLQEVIADVRSNLGTQLVEVTNKAADTLGIEVVDVRIKRIDLPEDGNVLGSVFSRMRAERTRVANELRAQGQEVLQRIQSTADREAQVIEAEAERDAQKLRGEGDAKAAEIYAQAYGKDPEFYAFHRSLEAYRQAFADGKGVLVLDPDSEFFRYFDQSGGSPASAGR